MRTTETSQRSARRACAPSTSTHARTACALASALWREHETRSSICIPTPLCSFYLSLLARLTDEYKRITEQFKDLQSKFRHFEAVDTKKYREVVEGSLKRMCGVWMAARVWGCRVLDTTAMCVS